MAEDRIQPKNKNATSKKFVPKKECDGDDDEDVISRLILHQLDDILIPLFLLLDITGLASARSVCRIWHNYLSSIFWRSNQAKRVLDSRLVKRWENEQHKRVEVVVGGEDIHATEGRHAMNGRHALDGRSAMEGRPAMDGRTAMDVRSAIDGRNAMDGRSAMDWCHANCSLNMRRCRCEMWCLVRGSRLILRLQGRHWTAIRHRNQEQPKLILDEFSRPIHQIKLCMKDNLDLDVRNNLDAPCFFKKSPRFTKVKNEKYIFSKNEKDANSVLITEVACGKLLKQFIPYTGWGDHHPVVHMKCDSHHLALLLDGRVFVYSIARLVGKYFADNSSISGKDNKGDSSISRQVAKDSRDNEDNALVLVATRKHQPEVNFIYLKDNILLTVGGNTIVMFDFWHDEISGTSEFFS